MMACRKSFFYVFSIVSCARDKPRWFGNKRSDWTQFPLLHPICTFAIKAIHWENRLRRCVADPTARQRSSLNHSCIDHWPRFCLQPNWNVMSPKNHDRLHSDSKPGWKHRTNIWISNKHPNCRWWHLLLLCALSCPARFQPLCANSDLVSQQDIRTDLWLVGIRLQAKTHWNPHGKVLKLLNTIYHPNQLRHQLISRAICSLCN